MNALYHEELMDHYRFPRNRGVLERPDIVAEELNPSCGDRIGLHIMLENSIITDIRFSGSGCVISQATASMLTEHCKGKTLKDALALTKDDILSLIQVPLGPNRLRCALLSVQVLHAGIHKFLGSPSL